MSLFDILIIVSIVIIVIHIIGFIIRYKIRKYMKSNITKIIEFDFIDNLMPFFKDVALEYEFLQENFNNISEHERFFLNFVISFIQTINFMITFLVSIFILVMIIVC